VTQIWGHGFFLVRKVPGAVGGNWGAVITGANNWIDGRNCIASLYRMRIVRSIEAMQRLGRKWRAEPAKVGFVPTMGYLHAGHVALIRRARREVGASGRVVVSIYVNPAQFGPNEDFSRYPRDLARDQSLCFEAGVDVLFTPLDTSIYAAGRHGSHSTYVVEESLSVAMEGASRPTHFKGVATIVAKLFNLVLPDVAIFGQKDFQQAAVISRMVRDLNFPVKIVVAPTLREPDGLAMSSRNKYLSADERRQACVLWQALKAARKLVRNSAGGLRASGLERELRKMIGRCPSARVDYIAFVNPGDLQPVEIVCAGAQLVMAVFIGKTRLIDNGRL
jgi:pantoate--beta-alanine ligase